jgi:hypothetical protein
MTQINSSSVIPPQLAIDPDDGIIKAWQEGTDAKYVTRVIKS